MRNDTDPETDVIISDMPSSIFNTSTRLLPSTASRYQYSVPWISCTSADPILLERLFFVFVFVVKESRKALV